MLSFFFTLVTGARRSLSLKLSDTRVYEPQIRARLGTTAHFCEVVVLKSIRADAFGGEGAILLRNDLSDVKPEGGDLV